jgi:putative membrane protein
MIENARPQASPNDYLANERTFLAWVRTGLGIMAFGFVVVKFSLFIKQVYALIGEGNKYVIHSANGYSGILGIVLVIAGLITVLVSYFNYRSTIKKLDRGDYRYSSSLITLLISFLLLIGALLIIYLVQTA